MIGADTVTEPRNPLAPVVVDLIRLVRAERQQTAAYREQVSLLLDALHDQEQTLDRDRAAFVALRADHERLRDAHARLQASKRGRAA